jgi:hypothetical protein
MKQYYVKAQGAVMNDLKFDPNDVAAHLAPHSALRTAASSNLNRHRDTQRVAGLSSK